jgi:hypothetical protein
MIAFNRDEIAGLPSTQDLPVRRSGRPDARTRGNGLFASSATRTLHQAAYKKVRLSGPAPRIDLQEEAPVLITALMLSRFGNQKLVTFLARPNKGT